MTDAHELENILRRFGLNGHIIGMVMKELVRRAIFAIRAERFVFEAQGKEGYSGKWDDVVTSADKKAQGIYVRSLRECFPEFGIVAEEENLRVGCKDPANSIYFTVDPLDGTKAFTRRQSHGIGTMIALVCNGEIIAVFVGDIMTQEIYGFRPGSEKVHRISEYDLVEQLVIDTQRPLKSQIVILGKIPSKYPPILQQLFDPKFAGDEIFKGVEVMSGSIGTTFARLWKGEAAAIVHLPHPDTPWDMTPIIGISEKLGFAFVRYNFADKRLEAYSPIISPNIETRGDELFVIHRDYLPEINERLTLL